jgi:hypothetical protein
MEARATMTTAPVDDPVGRLIARGPAACIAFARERFPARFPWLALAEAAASQSANHTLLGVQPLEAGLEWIRVAVELYERMADSVDDDLQLTARFTEPALARRAQALLMWGASGDDPARDPAALVARFKSIVDLSPAALAADTRIPRDFRVRTALVATQIVEPLLKVASLEAPLRDLAGYPAAAKALHEAAARM